MRKLLTTSSGQRSCMYENACSPAPRRHEEALRLETVMATSLVGRWAAASRSGAPSSRNVLAPISRSAFFTESYDRIRDVRALPRCAHTILPALAGHMVAGARMTGGVLRRCVPPVTRALPRDRNSSPAWGWRCDPELIVPSPRGSTVTSSTGVRITKHAMKRSSPTARRCARVGSHAWSPLVSGSCVHRVCRRPP